MSEKYFYLEESPYYPKHYTISLNHELFPFPNGMSNGSFNLLPARVLNISYANYLRLCRDEFGAEIMGKGVKYPVAYFTRSDLLMVLIKLLNARMKYIMYEQTHPYDIVEENNLLSKLGWS